MCGFYLVVTERINKVTYQPPYRCHPSGSSSDPAATTDPTEKNIRRYKFPSQYFNAYNSEFSEIFIFLSIEGACLFTYDYYINMICDFVTTFTHRFLIRRLSRIIDALSDYLLKTRVDRRNRIHSRHLFAVYATQEQVRRERCRESTGTIARIQRNPRHTRSDDRTVASRYVLTIQTAGLPRQQRATPMSCVTSRPRNARHPEARGRSAVGAI